jgi:hypothetical protein
MVYRTEQGQTAAESEFLEADPWRRPMIFRLLAGPEARQDPPSCPTWRITEPGVVVQPGMVDDGFEEETASYRLVSSEGLALLRLPALLKTGRREPDDRTIGGLIIGDVQARIDFSSPGRQRWLYALRTDQSHHGAVAGGDWARHAAG